MERLTYRNELGDAMFVDGISVCPNEVANRLAYYEDMEEQGRLKVYPVKAGQPIWCNVHGLGAVEGRVYGLFYEEINDHNLLGFRCALKGFFSKAFCIEDFGKTVFLTREEAENALKGGAN